MGSGALMHKFICLIATESRLKIKSKYSQTHTLSPIAPQEESANNNFWFWMTCKLRMILYFSMIFLNTKEEYFWRHKNYMQFKRQCEKIKFYWNTTIFIHLNVILGCFQARAWVEKLQCRRSMTCKAERISEKVCRPWLYISSSLMHICVYRCDLRAKWNHRKNKARKYYSEDTDE